MKKSINLQKKTSIAERIISELLNVKTTYFKCTALPAHLSVCEIIQSPGQNNDLRLINELTDLYERVSKPELAEHYYIIDDSRQYFPEVARALENGEFFNPEHSHYKQREQIFNQYARYMEYPRP